LPRLPLMQELMFLIQFQQEVTLFDKDEDNNLKFPIKNEN